MAQTVTPESPEVRNAEAWTRTKEALMSGLGAAAVIAGTHETGHLVATGWVIGGAMVLNALRNVYIAERLRQQ
jgi:hypothetical protein